LCKPGTVHHKLAQAGIHQTFQPVTHQRGAHPFSGDAMLIDGQLSSSLPPGEFRDLPAPPRGADEAEKQGYEAKFNLRARWRMARHSAPDNDGATRTDFARSHRSDEPARRRDLARPAHIPHARPGRSSTLPGTKISPRSGRGPLVPVRNLVAGARRRALSCAHCAASPGFCLVGCGHGRKRRVAAWEANGKRGVVEAATATGKTQVALAAMSLLRDHCGPGLAVDACGQQPSAT
jgi:hypothetical protein